MYKTVYLDRINILNSNTVVGIEEVRGGGRTVWDGGYSRWCWEANRHIGRKWLGFWGGGWGGGVELCGNLAQQQASRRGGGGAASSNLRIFSLSLSLAITFTSEIQVNHTRNQERHFEHGARHSSSCKKSYIMAFYELYETHIFTFTVLWMECTSPFSFLHKDLWNSIR
jgi:hypothetical protein